MMITLLDEFEIRTYIVKIVTSLLIVSTRIVEVTSVTGRMSVILTNRVERGNIVVKKTTLKKTQKR